MTTEELIKEVGCLKKANAGIMAIIHRDCCIMDEQCSRHPYKDEGGCIDYKKCNCGSFMISCIQTRSPGQVSPWVLEEYSREMGK